MLNHSDFEGVMGLEVHAHLLTNSKIFCGCSTKFGAEPNSHTCPTCMGLPGALPVLNKKVVDFAIKLGLALHCKINKRSVFARKNYYYPDLPKGYQISQYEKPICEHGYLDIYSNDNKKRIRILRIHMEEDAGKLVHENAIETGSYSMVDYNRSSIPLLEIVSEPDIGTPEEAVTYLKALRDVLVYLEICDGNMEEGSFRCDANVSVKKKDTTELGTRTELKNLNSFRFIERSLAYEINRQIDLIMSGGQVVQETRFFNVEEGVTYSMRGKEEAHDYRYFPEPDLLPLVVDDHWIDEMRKGLPELPSEKLERFVTEHCLPRYDAEILVSDRELAWYFEEAIRFFPEPKTVSNWIMTELLRELKDGNVSPKDAVLSPSLLAELLSLIKVGTISIKIGKEIFPELYKSGISPKLLVEQKGLLQISDETVIIETIDAIIDRFPKEVFDYRHGKEKLFGFFVGQAMKEMKGKANPKLLNELLMRRLKG
ncbi:MAG TPA: Asp-tRNA(Asn)/Glu-tRNA(Gln) amidotransferase subunit GatB [Syntrophorhabdus sp.]|jgi:aspartyl-tRNA(Asn)/glutamyl-tRNA(Gln) amidotransferase subunit B|nr:Asp-tRNA(Asn)/Glu-tRNA(Gln) amidotransferase subunit GatB [Syntrophorhabdus sp.]OPX93491.1 MAG: Aspartyl/glutamyl-tRNA(Asn/Gln) amidotransferase subunit B [Syntrophorhabdus sp. PtaB.Bin027]HOD78274.1 Asp-tRNA(Asn)/Glu-tRNA(Gln) amidotransferase subunit GatB [Syntrophorhabdus sp.]HQG26570.1 Asp-tRNA(Asn)/Glu-tRNA(Gln) amidotransferase subunit GatB [Syntrophorhabdus sp.]HQH81931.1 Asp-tRNA(Asn)/Glu-tRNA(Gln) amidotransferase subunit GatB [Syntrophorhabdus sp.]